MKLLPILVLFTTAVAAAAQDSSGDEAVLDLEETPTLRGLKSRNCDGVGPNTCDNRSNCKWIDDRSRWQQRRQGRNGRNKSNGWCDYRDSGYFDDDFCRDLGRRSCIDRSGRCEWVQARCGVGRRCGSGSGHCVNRYDPIDPFCSDLSKNKCTNRNNSYNCRWSRSRDLCVDRDPPDHDDHFCPELSRNECSNRSNSYFCKWKNGRCRYRNLPGYYDPLPLRHVANDRSPRNKYPLGLCEGDCDSDADCEAGLECMKRSNYEKVPGCSGSHKFKSADFCIESQPDHYDPLPLRHVANDRSPRNKYPLGLCEGDCDSDADCEAGLECMKRSNYERVPGCSGSHKFKAADFCIEKSSRRRRNTCNSNRGCPSGYKCKYGRCERTKKSHSRD